MKTSALSQKTIFSNLAVYGTTHALVDGVCAAVVFSILKEQIVSTPELISLVIIYNVIAFGFQSVIGLFTDYFKSPRLVAVLGCILVGLSAAIFPFLPVAAIILAGFGNSFFHVGGGSISLNLTPKKASAPGFFVAPGAIGILAGTLIGKNGLFTAWLPILALVILCALMYVVKKPTMNYKTDITIRYKLKYLELVLTLVLLSIAIRSLVGMVLVFPWKTDLNLLITLTAAVVLGKAFGGVLADKFGWIRIAVGALVLSIPFLMLGAQVPALGIIGVFLFNITMPITLVAVSNVLPGRPGFAFGLTCLALLLGVLPIFANIQAFFGSQLAVLTAIVISSIALYFALRIYGKLSTSNNDIY